MTARAKDASGQVDVRVKNGGIQIVSPIKDFPDEKWKAIVSLTPVGGLFCLQNRSGGNERAQMAADHQSRIGARTGRLAVLVSIYRAETWYHKTDQDRRVGDGGP